MSHRYALARLPVGKGSLAEFASGCPSAGGQRTSCLSHPVLSQRAVRASESRIAQRSMQRLQGLQHLSPRWLVCGLPFTFHRRSNPSVKRTVNGGRRSAVFGGGRAAVVRRLPHTLGRML